MLAWCHYHGGQGRIGHWLMKQLVLLKNATLGLCELGLLSLSHSRIENIFHLQYCGEDGLSRQM